MSDQTRIEIARKYLARMFGKVDPSHYLSIWSLPSKATRFVAAGSLDEAAHVVHTLDERGEDVYVGVCPHGIRPPKGRGSKATVSFVPALWVDIDLAHAGAHRAAAGTLPPDEDAVADLLEGVPQPSMIVRSGYGLHLYWTLVEPATVKQGARAVEHLQAMIRSAAQARGWHIDVTHDVARVLRVPGARNRKVPGQVVDVEILADSGADYKLEDFTFPTAAAVSEPEGAVSADPVPSGRDSSKAITVEDLRKALAKLRKNESADLLRKALKGDSISERGGRDAAMQRACSILAFLAPHNDARQLAELFRPMLSAWATEDGAKLTTDQEIDKAVDKIDRAQGDKRKKQAAIDAEVSAFNAAEIVQARGEGKGPYTIEEFSAWANAHGTSVEQLRKQLIIQHNDSCYVFVEGEYERPVTQGNLIASAKRDFAPAIDLGVRLTKTTKNGEVRKSPTELILDYGQVARAVVVDMGAPRSYYDAEAQTFHEACAHLRPIEPVYHEQIDTWLRILGGDRAEVLLDWLATVTDLSRPSTALYVSGVKSAGKSMLAQGLARLWHDGGPTLLENIIDQWNSDLMSCPLVWADEQLPLAWGRKAASARLREVITADTRTLNRKYHSGASLKGCVRVILTANTEQMLALGDEDPTGHDIDAFASRFIHIRAEQTAADYLTSIGGRTTTDEWVTGDRIAAHVLHLRQTRPVAPGDRFMVEAPDGGRELKHMLAGQTNIGAALTEWITREVAQANSSAQDFHVGDGKILVNAVAIQGAWDLHMSSVRVPTVKRLGCALQNIPGEPVRKFVGGVYRRYRAIDSMHILKFAEENQIGDVSQMEARINAPITVQ